MTQCNFSLCQSLTEFINCHSSRNISAVTSNTPPLLSPNLRLYDTKFADRKCAHDQGSAQTASEETPLGAPQGAYTGADTPATSIGVCHRGSVLWEACVAAHGQRLCRARLELGECSGLRGWASWHGARAGSSLQPQPECAQPTFIFPRFWSKPSGHFSCGIREQGAVVLCVCERV